MKNRYIKSTFLLFFFLFNLQSFTQYFDFAKSFGGSNAETGYSITTDVNGNIYTTGLFQDTVDFDPGIGLYNLISHGGGDIFITKFDENGNFIWAKSIGSTSHDAGLSIITDKKGNVYITGIFRHTIDFDPSNNVFMLSSSGGYSAFILKLNSSGDFVWAKKFSSNNGVFSNAIILDSLNNVYTTGYFYQTVDFDPGINTYNLSTNGSYDTFISKLDSNGNFIWAKSVGGSYPDSGKDINIDKFGNVYIIGDFASNSVDFDPGIGITTLVNSNSGKDDVFILKLDNSGNFIWAKKIGGNYIDSGRDIGTDSFGNVYINGTFKSTVDFDPNGGVYSLTSLGSVNSFILKLDNNGVFLWAKALDALAIPMCIDNFNNVYSAGVFSDSTDFDPGIDIFTLYEPSFSLYILKLNENGNFVWAKSFGGPSGMQLRSIFVNQENIIYCLGDFQGTSDFNPDTTSNFLVSNGSQDVFLLKFQQCTNTFETLNIINCISYTTPSGNSTYSTSGYYLINDTIINQCGFDSIMTINLTLDTMSTYSDSIYVCDSIVLLNGTTVYNTTSVIDTFTNICGLDSVYELYISIKNASYSIDTQIACGSYYTWIDGITYTTDNNTAIYTTTNVTGCDSIITLDLTFQSALIFDTMVVTACNSYTWLNGVTYTNSGTETYLQFHGNGCSTFNFLQLTINNPYIITDSINGCDSVLYNNVWYFSTSNINTLLGCDTLINTFITIHHSSFSIIDIVACDSSLLNGIWYYNSQSVIDTFNSFYGCDSITIINLSINNSSVFYQTLISCDSVFFNGMWYNNSLLVSDTLYNSVGCDSIINTNIIINNNATTSFHATCNSFTWIDGNTYTTNNNTATITMTNSVGCDSIITLDLIILNSSTYTDILTACDNSYTWLDGNTYTTNNNTAIFSTTNSNGCDSIITLNLTILNSTSSINTTHAPSPYTWLDGNTYTTNNNTATFTTTNSVGCDSIITLNLTIIDTTIQGNITTSLANPLQNSKVYLIEYTASADSVFAFDSTFTDMAGYYQFTNTFQNGYLKAVPNNTYLNEIPSYNVNSPVFQNADAVYLSYPFGNTDFSTIAGINPGGNGFIGGIVGNGAGKNTEVGEPIPNLSLLLMNTNNEVVEQTTTNAIGLFEFDNLEEATFSLWVDKAGVLNNLSPSISLVEKNIQDDLKFILHKTFLEDVTTVGIKTIKQSNFEIYPNPTNNAIIISNKKLNNNYSIEILNILGESLYSKTTNTNEFVVELAKEGLSKGTYFIKLTTENDRFISKIVLK